ncbi:UPF0158 family protein [Actinomycetospora termitidis]|uniref:UPF0158 family protein n=1 Tax=Actinomycetospora termitidis TaxID=3053470 RepID=A0ABT7M8C0_9PSEU|nr:UPF0158 family protein [Actinomycetospora sp. Odt1-22]MDL5156919.1 UPF0158 family protein [Actinomycetospora sp. Odt1-22]
MDDEDPRPALRGATYRGDGETVVSVLGRLDPREYLQIGGDGLLLALVQRVDGAADLAGRWVEMLRERDRDGDAELADQLDARLGRGPSPMLRPLPIDLEQLTDVLEGDPTSPGGRIDLDTGEVWPIFDDFLTDQANDGDEDGEEREWLEVPCLGSRASYRDMQDFIDTLDDPGRRDRLEIAIEGRGAFRRFKDVLARSEADLTRWYGFSDERQRGRARAWLADAGYAVSPRRGS